MSFSVGRNLERDCDDDATGFIPYLVENCICHRLGQKLLIHPPGLPAVMRSDQSYVCVNFRRWNALFGEFRKVVCSFQLRRLCVVNTYKHIDFNTMRQRFMLHLPHVESEHRFQFDTRPKQEMLPRPLRWPRVTRRIADLY